MTPCSRHRRFACHAALAALVLAASLHCTWEWQGVINQIASARNLARPGQAVPLGLPRHGCDNEFGCICRGATLAQPIDLTGLQIGQTELLPIDSGGFASSLPLALSVADRGVYDNLDFALPPLSGRQLRARYASLLI